ncbi:hypothetical protein EYC80_000518 [Monilinia laxa]|uniref:Uncharacterized protein n=1 Tax=Monilinia laxa TaxID=61186 RepID=A0A5N6KAW3_MONLA|nr:hypothetical protein EYC80_000518 [Monilinia laxa]
MGVHKTSFHSSLFIHAKKERDLSSFHFSLPSLAAFLSFISLPFSPNHACYDQLQLQLCSVQFSSAQLTK